MYLVLSQTLHSNSLTYLCHWAIVAIAIEKHTPLSARLLVFA